MLVKALIITLNWGFVKTLSEKDFISLTRKLIVVLNFTPFDVK